MSDAISFQPHQPPRPNAVYLSYQLSKALNYASKREGCTREDLFERVLFKYLNASHLDIVLWLSERDASEKKFVAGLIKTQ